MNFELFIARKIRSGGLTGKRLAGPVIKVATLGVALGMVVMILSLSIGLGFKREIRQKIIGFGSHIQLLNYDYNHSYDTNPIKKDTSLVNEVMTVPGVQHIQEFATKAGIIKTKDAIQGIVLKGVGLDFDWTFLSGILTEGNPIHLNDSIRSNEILISAEMANMLQLKLGDPVRMYFVQDNILARKFTISGIYDSHFPEYDNVFAFVDLRHIQKLNGWEAHEISGYEVSIDDFNNLEEAAMEIIFIAGAKIDEDGSMIRTKTITQVSPQIFGWLDLIDTNIFVILVLIVIVAGFNMISGLLILILERTNMIGILKAIGTRDWSLRKIFLYLSTFIIGRGLLWGNFIGVSLCMAQKYLHLAKLDPANYYLDTVPIHLTAWHLIILNLAVAAISLLMMLGPSYLVTRISPVKAIRFE